MVKRVENQRGLPGTGYAGDHSKTIWNIYVNILKVVLRCTLDVD